MQPILIIVMCVFAAIGYGVLHDQITARVCIEYFTVFHPPVFDTDDPTVLGLGWGVIATWWVGLALGLALAVAARAGSRPPRSAWSLVRPVLVLLVTMAVFALVSGVAGYLLAKGRLLHPPPWVAEKLPAAKHPAFFADWFAHTASYWTGFVGGGIQVALVWASRRQKRAAR